MDASLKALMLAWQTDNVIHPIYLVFIIFLLLVIVFLLYACVSSPRGENEHAPFTPHSIWSRRLGRWSSDRPSSPVGGTCLACGAVIREELSSRCPVCGAERQRCPICQRFVAGGQELLACPYCQMLSHANELRLWVSKKGTCPYCGRQLKVSQLLTLEQIQRLAASPAS